MHQEDGWDEYQTLIIHRLDDLGDRASKLQDGWDEYQTLIIHRLDDLGDRASKLQDSTNAIRVRLDKLHARSNLWTMIVGMIGGSISGIPPSK